MFYAEAEHETRWINLWSSLGAKGDSLTPYLDLRKRYAKPHRRYHIWKHVDDGIKELEPVRSLAIHPDEIEFAYNYHDAIYNPRVKDSINVEQSAELASGVMREAQLPKAMIKRVIDLILVTKHTSPPLGIDQKIMVDIDFSILGKEEPEFDEYERNIRLEYLFVDDRAFRNVRSDILEQFLKREHIYNTQFFRDKYEAQARKNLARSIRQLRSKFA